MSSDGPPACSRRRLLALAAAGTAAVAGCAGDDDGEDGGADPGTDRTTTTPTTTTPAVDPPDYDTSVAHDPTAWDGYDPDWTAPATSPLATPLTTERLVENLEIPWDLSFAPDGTLFISERVGRVLAFEGGDVRTVAEPDDAIDAGSVAPGGSNDSWWVKGGEGGTLGVAAHPTYPDPPLVYVYYTYATDGGKANKVVYVDVSADDPGRARKTVVDGIPAGGIHNGGRITFGPANYLWVTCGEGGTPALAQDTGSLGGSVLRVTPEGDPAPGNPDLGPGSDPRVYTFGHRNPQGVVFFPDGTTVASEHGPTGKDELNRLEPGANYGWPDVRSRAEYRRVVAARARRRATTTDTGTAGGRTATPTTAVGATADDGTTTGATPTATTTATPVDPDVHLPLVNTLGQSIAPTGSLFYTGDAVPSLRNRVLTGGLSSQRLFATTLTPPGAERPPADEARWVFDGEWTDDAYAATVHEFFQDRLGRVRHVEQGPGGGLYAITSNRDGRARGRFPRDVDDVLVRVRPA